MSIQPVKLSVGTLCHFNEGVVGVHEDGVEDDEAKCIKCWTAATVVGVQTTRTGFEVELEMGAGKRVKKAVYSGRLPNPRKLLMRKPEKYITFNKGMQRWECYIRATQGAQLDNTELIDKSTMVQLLRKSALSFSSLSFDEVVRQKKDFFKSVNELRSGTPESARKVGAKYSLAGGTAALPQKRHRQARWDGSVGDAAATIGGADEKVEVEDGTGEVMEVEGSDLKIEEVEVKTSSSAYTTRGKYSPMLDPCVT
eukprot:2530798-Rhodomonas_salina.2